MKRSLEEIIDDKLSSKPYYQEVIAARLISPHLTGIKSRLEIRHKITLIRYIILPILIHSEANNTTLPASRNISLRSALDSNLREGQETHLPKRDKHLKVYKDN